MLYADGKTKYEGEWQDDKPHGKGTLTWSDGTVYADR
ncbi:MORN repeat-containing protein, partial [Gordonia sp. (in: high G+C Gram-positive bacteria)]